MAHVVLLTGNGDGTFRSLPKPLPLPRNGTHQPTVAATADLDGDGISDIAIGDASFIPGIIVYLSSQAGLPAQE